MRIPLLIESLGPCESSWVPRNGLKRIRVRGLDREVWAEVKLQDDLGWEMSVFADGDWPLPGGIEGRRLRARLSPSQKTVSVELVS